MAITIRSTEEHEQMLDDLKKLTNCKASSQALLKGGQIAIEKTELARVQAEKIRSLEWELRSIKRKVSGFTEAFNDLMNIEDDE